MIVDTKLSDKQTKQLSLAISLNDVLNCIKKDLNSYLKFLNCELNNQEITRDEYKKELQLIENMKKENREEVTYNWNGN